jgi:hypothetical protein
VSSSAASSSQDLAEVDNGEKFAELPQQEEMKELKGRSNIPGFPPSYGLDRIGQI